MMYELRWGLLALGVSVAIVAATMGIWVALGLPLQAHGHEPDRAARIGFLVGVEQSTRGQ